jgi:hypothetical protein
MSAHYEIDSDNPHDNEGIPCPQRIRFEQFLVPRVVDLENFCQAFAITTPVQALEVAILNGLPVNPFRVGHQIVFPSAAVLSWSLATGRFQEQAETHLRASDAWEAAND